MDDVIFSGALRRQGFVRSEIARMERSGVINHLRRGAWTSQPTAEQVAHHRQLIRATLPMVSPDAVLSHSSAAVLHGLPAQTSQLSTVHWTRSRRGGGRARRQIHVYAAQLGAHEIVQIDGMAVTSLDRTVVDIARHGSLRTGVAVADAALRAGLSRSVLVDSAESAKHRPGGGRARRVAGFADERAETPGESWSRVELAGIGWAPSHLQYEVFDQNGVLIGRSDFGWEDLRILGEFDGKIKYTRELNGTRPLEDVLFAEKQREDALRRQDWEIVRWITDDLATPKVIGERLEKAARLSARRTRLRRTR